MKSIIIYDLILNLLYDITMQSNSQHQYIERAFLSAHIVLINDRKKKTKRSSTTKRFTLRSDWLMLTQDYTLVTFHVKSV